MTPDPRPTPIDSLPAVAVPALLAAWLAPFRDGFTAAVWPRVLVLIAGTVLAPGQRTAALRVMGLADRPGFGRYHAVLSEARWDGRALARTLLVHLLDRLLPECEVVIVPDDSIERRWGPCIRDRGILYVAARSTGTNILWSSEESGEPHASLRSSNLCGRCGPAFPRSAFMPDGIQRRGHPLIPRTRSPDAEPCCVDCLKW